MSTRKFRTYHEVQSDAGAEVPEQVAAQRARLRERLDDVKHVVAVASGKGGVGKSAMTANLAASLARRGYRVGAVDADLNGPSLARMLGVSGRRLGDRAEGIVPPAGAAGVNTISMELFQAEDDAPLRWKGPGTDEYVWRGLMESGVLREFLSDVVWGELDVLFVDVPPGTDRIHRLLEIVPDLSRSLLVTTPARMSRLVVSRSVRLVREASAGPVGLVANMTEFVCPECDCRTALFPGRGDEELATSTDLDLWARIPFDPRLGRTTDRGSPVVVSDPKAPSARAIEGLGSRLVEELELSPPNDRRHEGGKER